MKTNRIFFIIAGISGCIAVGLGAYGSHALRSQVDESVMRSFDIASKYQFYHTIALAVIGGRVDNLFGKLSAWFMVLGIVLFSGGIYLSVLAGLHSFTKITPFGGMSFMVSWLLFAVSAYMDKK